MYSLSGFIHILSNVSQIMVFMRIFVIIMVYHLVLITKYKSVKNIFGSIAKLYRQYILTFQKFPDIIHISNRSNCSHLIMSVSGNLPQYLFVLYFYLTKCLSVSLRSLLKSSKSSNVIAPSLNNDAIT